MSPEASRLILESLYVEHDRKATRLEPVGSGHENRAAANALRWAIDALAEPHMTEDETDLLLLCDEYEAVRNEAGRLADATAELCAHRISEHFELIRRAIQASPRQKQSPQCLEAPKSQPHIQSEGEP